MKNATLLFLVKKSEDKITHICLAMKKRGFGAGRWNGVGGKVEEGETLEQAVLREANEEIGVTARNIWKVGEMTFTFPHKPEWNQVVHTYFTTEWDGEPQESDEMKPQWYDVTAIPFDEMWPADKFWLPRVIEGELVRRSVVFGEGDTVLEQTIHPITSF
jgi:mutator protein MutT